MSTGGVFIAIAAFMGIAPASNAVDNTLVQNFPNVCTGGVCLPALISQSYYLFGIGIALLFVGIAVWFFAAIHSEEPDTGEFTL